VSEFATKKFLLLWRGSRDGFGSSVFHEKCDGHANTLTLILDTNGSIFGGFTPIAWDSTSFWKTDESVRSFIFTLKNPHNSPAMKFSLQVGQQRPAVCCDSSAGPTFGSRSTFPGSDIYVSSNCDVDSDSHTYFGRWSYTNSTGVDGSTFFTGSQYFTVREIEVFEISD
jgi:ribosomal protein L31